MGFRGENLCYPIDQERKQNKKKSRKKIIRSYIQIPDRSPTMHDQEI